MSEAAVQRVSAVVSGDAVSVLRMNDGGELIGRLGKNFKGNLFRIRVEALVGPLADKTGELGDLRRSADGLDVFVDYFIGRELVRRGRPAFAYDFHSVRIVGFDAVLIHEAGNSFRVVGGAMAGVASHLALPAEIALIEHVHHDDHLARGLLQRRVDGVGSQAVRGVRRMAIDAVQAGGRGKEAHGVHEFLDGNAFEQLDVLENVFRHLRLRPGRGRGLALRQRNADEKCECYSQDVMKCSFRSKIHFGYSPCDTQYTHDAATTLYLLEPSVFFW